ncbi:hypothetical protein BS78_10G123500, partial [Paspalum vaginatum]
LESGQHLFVGCSFTRNIWGRVACWVALDGLQPSNWGQHDSVHHWWATIAKTPGCNSKGLRSLLILIIWTIWRERNARIFDHKQYSDLQIFNLIKFEANSWVCAGAKHLAVLVASC